MVDGGRGDLRIAGSPGRVLPGSARRLQRPVSAPAGVEAVDLTPEARGGRGASSSPRGEEEVRSWRGDLHLLVFDLDGTLVDSRRDLAAAVNALRAELGFEPLPVGRIVGMIGRGARVLVQRALADRWGDSAPGAAVRLDRAFERFLDLYFERCLDETRPYDGVPEMLAALAERFPLAVLTNKPERHSLEVLEGLSLAAWFRSVVGGDTVATRKPDPAGLLLLAERLGAQIGRTLFVGDSATDGETAKAAGAPLALVSWGFGAAEELDRFPAALRPTAPQELSAALLGSGF